MARFLMMIVVALAVVLSSCSSSNSDEVDALEARIAELETSSSTMAPTTVTSSTTTTQPPTTTQPAATTTLARYNLSEVDLDTLNAWANVDDVDPAFIRFASGSCENAVKAMARVSNVLGKTIILAVGESLAAQDGTGTVSDAAEAFDEVSNVVPYGGRAANILLNSEGIGGAQAYVKLVRDTIMDSILSVTVFSLFVHDVEEDTVDTEAFELWGAGLLETIEELDSLGTRSWSLYCP